MYKLIYSKQVIKQGDLLELWNWLKNHEHPPIHFLQLIAPDGEIVKGSDWRLDYQTWVML